jgi:transmembrane sensor
MDARDTGFNRQIAEQAAEWFVDFSVGDVEPEQLVRFNLWLRTSPVHVRAYLQLTAFWEDAELLKLDSEAMETLARQVASGGNVVSLQTAQTDAAVDGQLRSAARSAEPERAFERRSRPMFRPPAIAASVALLCAFIGVAFWAGPLDGETYVTETGEQRMVTLTDGSVVQLNSQSRLRVSFSEQTRLVELIEGQALFEVAKNAARPFVVVSGRTRVRAVGTQFDVYRKRAGTVITVVEGRVAVSDEVARGRGPLASPDAGSPQKVGSDGAAVLLSAGERVTVTSAAILAPQRTNLEVATAWTQKKLVFDAAPLSDVVAEFNRYSRQRLILEDATLEEVHISGVFAATSVDHLLQFLQERFDVEVEQQDEQIRISRRR